MDARVHTKDNARHRLSRSGGREGPMFIQVVRCRVKPGAWPQVEAWLRRWQAEEAPGSVGYQGEYLLREQDDPNGGLFIALFEDAEAAQRASASPATTA